MLSIIGPNAATEFELPLATKELQKRLDAMYDAGRLSELINPHAVLLGLSADFPTPPETDWPRPRLGVIHWPVVGIARYAFACMLLDEYTLGQLRTQITAAGDNTCTFRFRDDPTDESEVGHDVPMRLLGTRPLVRTTSSALTTTDEGEMDVWVGVFVDDRYADLNYAPTSVSTGSWSSLFTSLGITYTVADSVDADYLTPNTDRWTLARLRGRSRAWLADVAATFVGSRFVTVPGAAAALQRPTGARAATLSTAHITAVSADRLLGGGPVLAADVNVGLATAVNMTFGGPTETTPVVVQVTTGQDPWNGEYQFSTWVDAAASTGSGPRASLAAQWEADWRAWQYDQYDTLYAGFVAAPASGFVWAVEWTHTATEYHTRFSRAPIGYGSLLAPQAGLTAGGSGGSITIREVDGSPSISATILEADQADGFVITNPSGTIARLDQTPASATTVGYVNTTTQSFAGDKTFTGTVNVDVDLNVTNDASIGNDVFVYGDEFTFGTGLGTTAPTFKLQPNDGSSGLPIWVTARVTTDPGYPTPEIIFGSNTLSNTNNSVRYVMPGSSSSPGSFRAGRYVYFEAIDYTAGVLRVGQDYGITDEGLGLGAKTAKGLVFDRGLNPFGLSADHLQFWDDSAGQYDWLQLGSGISISGTTLSATGTGGTLTSFDITQPSEGITASGGPITSSGSITLALANDLAALEAMSGTGMVVRTGSETYAQRTLQAGTNIAITNGDGVGGDPSIAVSGLVIGTDVQAWSTRLDSLSGGTATAISDLTDSTTGTAGGTVSDVTILYDQTILNNNFASIVAKLTEVTNALRAANLIP